MGDDDEHDDEERGLTESPKDDLQEQIGHSTTRQAREIAAAPPERAGHEETVALYDRIGALERRCRMLQKKLDARPIIYQSSKPGHGPLNLEAGMDSQPVWEPWIRSHLPSKAADTAACCCRLVEQPLRRFTQRLLRNDAWLYLFYVHLLVLYTVAASCMASGAPVAGSPA